MGHLEHDDRQHHQQHAVCDKLDVRSEGEPGIRRQGRGKAKDQPGQNEGQAVKENLSAASLNGHDVFGLKLSGGGLVQQRFLQRLQRGVLPLGEAGEAMAGGGATVQFNYPNGVKSISPGLPRPRGYPG